MVSMKASHCKRPVLTDRPSYTKLFEGFDA